MLRLPPDADGRAPDDVDGSTWRLPPALVPAAQPDGSPDVLLCRYEGGGSLRLRLRGEAVTERPVPILGGRLRFVLSTPAGTSSGDWHPVGPRAADLVDVLLPLGPEEAAVALRVGEAGGSLVEVEVELDYHGRLPRLPWSAAGDVALLRAALEPALGPAPWTTDTVEQALEAVDPGSLRWRPNFSGAPPRNAAQARPALAAALLEALFTPAPGGLGWAEGDPTFTVDLEVPRTAVRRWVRRWSFSAFFRSLADPSRHFVDAERPVPFETRSLRATCALPLGPDAVDTLTLELDAGEITGLTSVQFTAGGPGTVRVPFIHRSSAAPPRWRVLALVAGRDGLVRVETPWRDAELLLVDITPAATGIHPLRVDVDPEVWSYASHVDVVAGSRAVTLEPARAAAWLMFRQPPASATVTFRSGEHTFPTTLPVREGGLRITAAPLAPGEGVPMRLVPSPALLAAAAWAALAQGDRVETLEPDGVVRTGIRRSRLDEPELRYRLVQMRRRPDGNVEPAETSEERVARGTRVEL